MEKVLIVKDSIYKEVEKRRLSEYTVKGFAEADDNGKPKGKEGGENIKAIKGELEEVKKANKELIESYKKLEERNQQLQEELKERNVDEPETEVKP